MKYQIAEIEKSILYYKLAKSQLETYINGINNEFEVLYDNNPINHIKTRIKTVESIIGKLKRKKLKINKENVENLNDIVGARIVVNFIENIYEIVKKINQNTNINIVEEKNYIDNPKDSGYRGYHVIISIPISIEGIKKDIKCEIQIRTIAMDFWASNEHKLNYKSTNNSSEYKRKWIDAADKVWDLDTFMNELYLEEKENKINYESGKQNIELSILKSIDKLGKIRESYR